MSSFREHLSEIIKDIRFGVIDGTGRYADGVVASIRIDVPADIDHPAVSITIEEFDLRCEVDDFPEDAEEE